MADVGALAIDGSPLDPPISKSVQVVDAVITLAAVTATALAVLQSFDGGINLVNGASAALLAIIVTASGWMLRRTARGVFLTPSLRVVALMAFAASLATLLGGRTVEPTAAPAVHPTEVTPKQAPIDVTTTPEYVDMISQTAFLKGQLRAAAEETARLREALQKEGAERQRLVGEADAVRTARLLDQARAAKPVAQPNSSADAAGENGVLARAWNIPPTEVVETRRIVSQTEVGREMIRAILEGAPLIGPALGSLFGGGRTRATTEQVMRRLNGGNIPAAADLRELLQASDDPERVKAELLALVESGRSRNVISPGDADKIRDAILSIANSVRPIDPVLLHARATIARALTEGRPCSTDLTKPDFVAFSTATQKDDLIQATPEGSVRNCLDRYPVQGQPAP